MCELDVYSFIKVFDDDNKELFMDVYIDDLIKIIQGIQNKKKNKGFENRDMDLKLAKIKAKVEKVGNNRKADVQKFLKRNIHYLELEEKK